MKIIGRSFFIFFCMGGYLSSFSKAMIQEINTSNSNLNRTIKIGYQGNLRSLPVLKLKTNYVEVELEDFEISPSLKSELLKNPSYRILSTKDRLSIRIAVKRDARSEKKGINLRQQENKIYLTVPENLIALSFNESLESDRSLLAKDLANTLNQVNSAGQLKNPERVLARKDSVNVKASSTTGGTDNVKNEFNQEQIDRFLGGAEDKSFKVAGEQKEAVKSAQAIDALGKPKTNTPFWTYGLKMLGVTFAVILAFLFVANIFRKKVFKRGKLNLLKGTKVVEILNTTYVSPKRNLLLVQVNEQMILLGNSEAGLQYLTDVKNPLKVLKEADKNMMGKNFDERVEIAHQEEIQIKEKRPEDIYKSHGQNNLVSRDNFKTTKSLTEKFKSLRPLG